MKNYYFNGGLYLVEGKKEEYKFGIVKPTNGLPYITTSEVGIIGAEHHSSVYRLEEDHKTATLVRNNEIFDNPRQVTLSLENQRILKLAIKKYEDEQ